VFDVATLLVSLAMASAPTTELVARVGTDSLRLTQGECLASVAEHIKPEFVSRFKRAIEKIAGQTNNACWTAGVSEGKWYVFVMYEDGQRHTFSLEHFIQEPGL
jgi:hypothetical protein